MKKGDNEEIIELLEQAKGKVEEASCAMEQVVRIVKDLPTDYNMSGNMETYVINYLTKGVDSIADKIDKYIMQLRAFEEEGEDE
jgi:hypothetical protein